MPEVKKNLIRRILEHKGFMVVNLIILLFIAMSFGREFYRDYEIQSEIDALITEAEQLATHNLEVSKLNASLETETFLEEEARLKLGLSKPGERLVVVIDDAPETISLDLGGGSEAIPREELENVSNPERWSYYFFNQHKFELLKAYGY